MTKKTKTTKKGLNIISNIITAQKHSCNAFTLAEVLITLGIIGVVSAVTMPTLIQRYTYKITETRLAKFYSIYNQAIRLATAEYGEPILWEFTIQEKDSETNELINKSDESVALFDKYLGKHIKISSRKEVFDEIKNQKIIMNYLADGSAFSFAYHTNTDIYYYPNKPENCLKKEIRGGICQFSFSFDPMRAGKPSWEYASKYEMTPYVYAWNGTKETLYKGGTYPAGCDMEEYGAYCSTLIRYNGWKIPADYPRKIQY